MLCVFESSQIQRVPPTAIDHFAWTCRAMDNSSIVQLAEVKTVLETSSAAALRGDGGKACIEPGRCEQTEW